MKRASNRQLIDDLRYHIAPMMRAASLHGLATTRVGELIEEIETRLRPRPRPGSRDDQIRQSGRHSAAHVSGAIIALVLALVGFFAIATALALNEREMSRIKGATGAAIYTLRAGI